MKRVLTIILYFLLCAQSSGAVAGIADLKILGWVENAYLPDPGLEVKAKLDSGAETSSLDSRVIKKFRQDGKRWVRFSIIDRESGNEFILVKERVRTIGVVQHDGSRQTRPVVIMDLCIGGQQMTTEVSLIDRSEFNYPLLLGRSALEGFTLIDPGNVFLADADCQSGQDSEIDP